MKRSTAINRLAEVATELDRSKVWPGPTIVAGYVFGAILESVDEVERVQLAFVVDEPAESVPWMSRPARLEALASFLRFDKFPLSWSWRPAAWPVWNHSIRRAVRFWSADGGADQDMFDALNDRRLDQLRWVEPVDGASLRDELTRERDVARRCLVDSVDSFYDRQWRHDHNGNGIHAEDHLWWAAAGYLDLDNALREPEH